MAKGTRRTAGAHPAFVLVVSTIALTVSPGGLAVRAETDQLPIAHIRTSSPVVRRLVRDAFTRSPTFRQIAEMIEATDGIVYVEEGKCGHSVRACLVLGLAISGPNRLLRILVDSRRADWDLQGSIGHELRHAIEVLTDPAVRSDGAMYHFYSSEGSHQVGGFETEAAIQAGERVRAELRR